MARASSTWSTSPLGARSALLSLVSAVLLLPSTSSSAPAAVVPAAVVDAGPDASPIVDVSAGATRPERSFVIDTGDVPTIQRRGALRVLVFGARGAEEELSRTASTLHELEIVDELAERLQVEVEPVPVERFDDLIPLLLEGKGDLIAARLTETPARKQRIAMSRPLGVVSELVVGKRGAPHPPRAIEDLVGRAVTVRASSSYRESLEELRGKGVRLDIVDADESRDEPELLRDVAAGKIALTICDSDLFGDISAYQPDVEVLFPLRADRQIVLGMRPTNPLLKEATDQLLMQHAMTEHRTELSTGDLREIKKRGSLRVLLRNNATSYFLYKGVQQGFDYELMKEFAKRHSLRLDAVVPAEHDDIVPALLSGRGDVIATEMTITDERKAQLAFSKPYLTADEVLIQRAGEPPIKSAAELAGRAVHVRPSSSYRTTLDALRATLPEGQRFTIVDEPEDSETEALVARVAAGAIPLTVADSTIAGVEIGARGGAQATLVLAKGRRIGFGVRADNPELRAALDSFVARRSGDIERLRRKYFARPSRRDAAHLDVRATGKLSPFDDVIKKYSRQYGIDWRLMAAQAYQESFFDPKAESWCGAVGLFQVMPRTGRALGFKDVRKVDTNVHAGIMYMAQLIESFDPQLPFKQRVRFALASYNAGPHHVADARALAAEMGLDPNRWFGNVEKAMLRLEDPKVARRMRHGYCRGSEPVKYVSDIQSRYDNWVSVFE